MRSPWGHCYLSLPGDRTRRAGPGAQGRRPILWSRGSPELLGSPRLLCSQEGQQAQAARRALGNLWTCSTRKRLCGREARARTQARPRGARTRRRRCPGAGCRVTRSGESGWSNTDDRFRKGTRKRSVLTISKRAVQGLGAPPRPPRTPEPSPSQAEAPFPGVSESPPPPPAAAPLPPFRLWVRALSGHEPVASQRPCPPVCRISLCVTSSRRRRSLLRPQSLSPPASPRRDGSPAYLPGQICPAPLCHQVSQTRWKVG